MTPMATRRHSIRFQVANTAPEPSMRTAATWNGDPAVGFGQDQLDHPRGRPAGAVSAPIRLRLMVSSLVLTPKTVPSGISSHSSSLSGSDATTTAL